MGVPYQFVAEERGDVAISAAGDSSGKELILSDCFFKNAAEKWLSEASLPPRPLGTWDINNTFRKLWANSWINCIEKKMIRASLPVIYGEDPSSPNFLEADEKTVRLGLDIFGSAFFMLSRYEEAVKTERDEHGRFPVRASLAYQEGFLERPIINEYLEALWECLKFLWPGLTRKKREFRVLLTHDVDSPFVFMGVSPWQVFKNCGGDVLKRRDLSLALRRARAYWQVRQGKYENDLHYTFRTIMDLSEKLGLRSAFYFKTGGSDLQFDLPSYSVNHPWVRALIREIRDRGHEIGFHPSYSSFGNVEGFKQEAKRFRELCEEEKIEQEQFGGRQHYLRWEAPATWQNWEEAGFDYDSTLSYADYVGFRCGICYEYPVYNVKTRQALKLRERPLTVMEGTALEEKYMGLPAEEAKKKILALRELCRRFDGDFVLLWHNSFLISDWQVKMYKELLHELG